MHEDAAKGVELKPCPFCGAAANLEQEQSGQNCVAYVYCVGCDIEGEHTISDNWIYAKKKAVEAWNTRADLAAPEQSAGEVAEALRYFRVWRKELTDPAVYHLDKIIKHMEAATRQPPAVDKSVVDALNNAHDFIDCDKQHIIPEISSYAKRVCSQIKEALALLGGKAAT